MKKTMLLFEMIATAHGDTAAMCAIFKYYEGYMAAISTRTLKDENGNKYSYVDEEIRNRLKIRLIAGMFNFRVA